jgi:hypothetical protein
MKEITLLVPSASNNSVIYKVRVAFDGEKLSITCTCPGAKNGLLCKHRKSLLYHNMDLPGQEDAIQLAYGIIKESQAPLAIEKLEKNYAELKIEYDEIMKRKSLLEYKMNDIKTAIRHRIDSESPGTKKKDVQFASLDKPVE